MTHPGFQEAERRISAVRDARELDLSTLDLDDEDLRALAVELGSHPQITKLYLRNNRLTSLPDVIGNLAALIELHLDNNQLTRVSDGIGTLAALTTLRLDDNQLTTVPDAIGNLAALRSLRLDNNQLTTVPDVIGNLTALTTLYLGNNRLSTIPETIGDIPSLTTLYVDHNQLSTIPDSIGNLTALTTLYLNNNQLSTIPDSIGNLTALTTLYLNNNQLSTIPDSIGNLTALTRLWLNNNGLSTIPDGIGNLTALTRLDLDNNQLSTLPGGIGNLTALTRLWLDNNQLTMLPTGIGDLTALTSLYLGNNRLTAIPEEVGNLTALTALNLCNNRLTTLPERIGNLTALTTLYLDTNSLTTLPDGIGNLTTLTTLYLDDNRLTTIPKSLGGLTELRVLGTADNLLPPEMEAASAEGTDELLRFLRLIEAEGIELAEAKLVLVGEGGVGKSSLLAALRGDPWMEGRDQTHGLEIKPLEVRHLGRSFTLNGWDFGGQQAYRPTHQLFFTTPGVYIVVWKPREGPELGMVEQWLAMIQHRVGFEARVHVVATHGGPSSRVTSVDETHLRERFGSMIVDFHEVDSKKPETLWDLRAAISETAAQLPHARRLYPASWLRARETLARSDAQSLTYGEYMQAMTRNGLTATSARSLAINAHATGHWIHYGDEPALAQIVILKPDWLSVAIASVIEDPEANLSGGLVPNRRFGQIWSRPVVGASRYYNHTEQQLFLRMMERFELTYRVPELDRAEPLSLLAQLVPADRPDLTLLWHDFRPHEATAVQICQIVEKGTDRLVAPEGLIFRLIVRLHRHAIPRDQAPDGAHWRGGLVVESRYGARALITLTPDGVRVQVRGPDPYSYLRQIGEEIRDCVDGFWGGLTSRVLLPCREPCGLGRPGRGLFDLDKLVEARDRHGRTDFPCSASDCSQYPAIDVLLGGVAVHVSRTTQWRVVAEGVARIQDQLDELTARHSDGTGIILTQIESLDDELTGRLHRMDAELTGLMRSFNDEAADGPRLFSLVPIERTALQPGWTTRRMQLTLYCEHSRWPVHALNPGQPRSGVYTLDVPREWWTKAVPLLKLTSALIKPFLGIGLAATELDLTTKQWAAVKEQLALGKESLNAAADAARAADAKGREAEGLNQGRREQGGLGYAEGGVLRTLHAVLRAKDPTFADLRRVTDPSGRYLWIHPKFLSIYHPQLPNIPV